MTRWLIIIAAAFLACLIGAIYTMPAKAQIACPPMAQLLNELQIRFKEFPLVTADIPGLKPHDNGKPGRNLHHHQPNA